jgi:hypothetical protein
MTITAVNFSAKGTRWRAIPIARQELTKEYVPPLPGTGLLFTSADGDIRFLALEIDAVPTIDYLRTKPVNELGTLVDLAKPLAR